MASTAASSSSATASSSSATASSSSAAVVAMSSATASSSAAGVAMASAIASSSSAAVPSSSSAAAEDDDAATAANAHPCELRFLLLNPWLPFQNPWGLRFLLDSHRPFRQLPWGLRFPSASDAVASSLPSPMLRALPSAPASADTKESMGRSLSSSPGRGSATTLAPIGPAPPSAAAPVSSSAPKGPAHPSSSSTLHGGIHKFQVLTRAAAGNKLAANQLLLATLTENLEDIEKWLKVLLGNSVDDLDSARASLSDLRNTRSGVLHLCASLGSAETCEFLISSMKHDVNALILDSTPLLFAIESRAPINVMKLLIDQGADCNGAGAITTPLLLAAKNGHAECIKLLLRAGGNANIPNMDGKLPIEVAATNGFYDCVMALFGYTSPLPGYSEWSIDEILKQASTDETFFDVPMEEETEIQEDVDIADNTRKGPAHEDKEDNTRKGPAPANSNNLDQTAANKKQDQSSPPIDPGKTENKVKGNNNFFFGLNDKLPTLLLSTCLMGIAAVKGDTIKINDLSFQFLCAGASAAVVTSANLFGHMAYYKETETTNEVGYKIGSWLTYGLLIYLLVALSVIVLGFDKCKPAVIVPLAIITAVAFTLAWRIPNDESKTVWRSISDRLKRRRDTIRDNTPLPTTTQQ